MALAVEEVFEEGQGEFSIGLAYTLEMVVKEARGIRNLIEDTPNHIERDLSPADFKKAIGRYHSKIIGLLDSGFIIGIPSMLHRNLHQSMWLEGHLLYGKFRSMIDTVKDFISCEGLINRFDVWYAKRYIEPFLTAGGRLGKTTREAYERAKEEAIEVYHHPLEELALEEIAA